MPKTLEEYVINEIETLKEENQKLRAALCLAIQDKEKTQEDLSTLKEATNPKLSCGFITFDYVWDKDPSFEKVKQILNIGE